MFLTAMAANPLATKLASEMHIEVSWGLWAIAALVPGIVSLVLIPLILYKLYPPEIKQTPGATQLAKSKLAEMGRVQFQEWIMLGVFLLLLFLLIFGEQLGHLDSATTALAGLSVLLVTGVLTWKDILEEKNAWDTLVWFAALLMMATSLNELMLIRLFQQTTSCSVRGASPVVSVNFARISVAVLH